MIRYLISKRSSEEKYRQADMKRQNCWWKSSDGGVYRSIFPKLRIDPRTEALSAAEVHSPITVLLKPSPQFSTSFHKGRHLSSEPVCWVETSLLFTFKALVFLLFYPWPWTSLSRKMGSENIITVQVIRAFYDKIFFVKEFLTFLFFIT